MADSALTQQDFGGGIFRGRKAPANAVYDAINALVDDEAQPFKRGGSKFSADYPGVASGTLLGLAHAHFDTVSMLIAWTDTAWAGGLAGTLTPPRAFTRGVGIGGLWIAPASGTTYDVVYYAGAGDAAAFYLTGTADVSAGSTLVTGGGTDWDPNVSVGSILSVASQPALGVVTEVIDDSTITLREGWEGTSAAGQTYKLLPVQRAMPIGGVRRGVTCVAAVGTPQRLLLCVGNRVYFSPPGNPYSFPTTDYHELPDNALITGAEGVGDTAVLFTTAGVWRISNMNYDPVDAAGNQQHTVTRISKDVLLWGDSGICGWAGGLIVPSISDVVVMGTDGATTPITESIRPLYHQYVEAGYKPGTAAVFRSHYLLPILNGTTLVDVLVCRLDRGSAWTRWDDHAACGAYVTAVGAETREPVLYGIQGARVVDLTGCFTPDATNTTDADLAFPAFTVETRDFDLTTPTTDRPGTVEKTELVYELDGSGATVALSWSTGLEGSSYTALTPVRGGGESDGNDYSVWRVNKSRRSVRLKIVQSGGAARMILRRVVLRLRRPGF